MIGELNKNEIEEILKNHYIGRIGCCVQNTPYIIPVTYCYDTNSHSIIGYSSTGTKINILTKNPLAVFEVEEIEDISNWKTVICTGQYEALKGSDARNALHIFVERIRSLTNTNDPNIRFLKDMSHASSNINEKIIYRIKINSCTGRFEENK